MLGENIHQRNFYHAFGALRFPGPGTWDKLLAEVKGNHTCVQISQPACKVSVPAGDLQNELVFAQFE